MCSGSGCAVSVGRQGAAAASLHSESHNRPLVLFGWVGRLPVRDEAASVQWASPSARLQFSVIFPGRVELITQPVHTEHRDRGALRSTLQGIELMALIPIQLGSGQRWSGDFVFRATRR